MPAARTTPPRKSALIPYRPSDIEAHIYTSMPAGSETLVTVKVGGVSLVIKALGITHYNPDQVVYLSIDLNKINVFDKKSTNLIKYSV